MMHHPDLEGFNLLTKHLKETFLVFHPVWLCLGGNLEGSYEKKIVCCDSISHSKQLLTPVDRDTAQKSF